MNIKRVKGALSALLPKGELKEILKQNYYNLLSPHNIRFARNKDNIGTYETTFNNLKICSVDPLYNVVDEFNYYLINDEIKPGSVIIDAGANRGNVSVLLAKLAGSSGIVYAFEPDAINAEAINKNSRLNGLDNISIQDYLLWDKSDLVDFNESGSVSSSAKYLPDGAKITKKRAISIDDWVHAKGILKLDFVKMDIEGAEIEAVNGARETIKKLRPRFAIASYHYVDGEQTYIKLEKLFMEMGYPYKTIKFNRSEIITFAG